MGVLDKAFLSGANDIPEEEMPSIPDGATKVEAQFDIKGWSVVFDTPSGKVSVPAGGMKRALWIVTILSARMGSDV